MTDKDQKIGEIVKGWLHNSKLSQCQASEKMGIKQPSLSQMINGRIPFPKSRLEELMELCDPSGEEVSKVYALLFGEHALGPTTAPNDYELEILKRDAKIAQYVLQIAYLERKVKRLQDLNFNQEERDES